VQNNSLFSGSVLQGPHTLTWDGTFPVPLTQIDDQVLGLKIRAVSIKKDRQRDELIKVTMDRKAPVFETFVPPPSTAVQNDQQLAFTVKYDGAGYNLAADFGELDSNFPRAYSVADSGNGAYRILYTVSASNARPDGPNKDVALTATDPAGNTTVTPDLVRFCLSNLPPRFVSAQFLGKSGPFRKLDQISLRTKWVDGQWTKTKPLQVTADFSKVDTDFSSESDVIIVPGFSAVGDTAIFDIAYKLSLSNEYETVSGPVTVTAADNPSLGCGSSDPMNVLTVRVDSEVPPRPTLTASAGVVRTAVDTLRGTAEGSAMVIINRGTTPVDTFMVPSYAATSFSGPVTLEPGENKFNAVSVDSAGNQSKPTIPDLVIFYVQGDVVQIPGPFTPGSTFFVGLLSPARHVTVRIFNLDGVEVARLEAEGGDLYNIPWDGIGNNGSLVSSGPYLAVVEVEDAASGHLRRFRKAFVFARRGS
jgi:hypothetical protein